MIEYACDECTSFAEHDGKIFCRVSGKELELADKAPAGRCSCQDAASYWKQRALRAERKLSDCIELNRMWTEYEPASTAASPPDQPAHQREKDIGK